MPGWGTILITVLRFVLTDKTCRSFAAREIERLVDSTETRVDDKIAAPILRYLKK